VAGSEGVPGELAVEPAALELLGAGIIGTAGAGDAGLCRLSVELGLCASVLGVTDAVGGGSAVVGSTADVDIEVGSVADGAGATGSGSGAVGAATGAGSTTGAG
jgi:hypothetical protein